MFHERRRELRIIQRLAMAHFIHLVNHSPLNNYQKYLRLHIGRLILTCSCCKML